MKNKWFYLFFCIIILINLTACSNQKNTKFTTAEYTKEIVVQNTKFNSALEEISDQIDTFNGSDASKQRLTKLIDDALAIIEYIKNDIKQKVPDENYAHYESMVKAYDLYKEGLELYKANVPAPLSEERKNNLRLADSKCEDGKNALKNIK